MSEQILYTTLESPIGPLLLAADDAGLRHILFQAGPRSQGPDPAWRRVDSLPLEAADQLDAYFAGNLREFDLPLAPEGTTFQLEVWAALEEIPYGQTTTYAGIANQIGRPTSTRAVGAANGQNPLPIVVPCHRVIGSDGSLTGFGGGLPIKQALLALERGENPHFPEQLSLL